MRLQRICTLVCCVLPWTPAEASVDDLLSMSLEELSRIEVSIATGTPRTLREAPSVASVITSQEIESIGAQHMDDALKAVPGLHVSHAAITYESRYYFRGLFSNNNPQTLVLVNGVPMTSMFLGDRIPGWPGVPVHAIERIEVVRGPGSAVFGADAFGGVINIITKGAADTPSDRATLSYGSFDTRHASLLQRGTVGGARTLFALDYRQSDGDDSTVKADWATGWDQIFGTSSSLAPGPLNLNERQLDARADVEAGDWRVRASWQRAWNMETGQGLFDALDPVGTLDAQFSNLDLVWNDPALAADWEFEGRLNAAYKKFASKEPLRLLPPGSFCFPFSPSCFPDGMQDDLGTREAQAGVSFTALFSGWETHRLRIGTGFFWGDLYKTTDRKNFDASGPGLPVPLGSMVDFSDTPFVFQPEAQRTNRYLFGQDEWQFARDWELTAGVRHDHYSDFGGTTNPRLALVWNATPEFTGKLMYGEAFRAPAFAELYVTNIGVLGNPDLKPEKLRNQEVAFSWHPAKTFSWDLNVFRYRIRDFIQAAPDPSMGGAIRDQNVGRLEGKGAETEVRWQLSVPVQLLANFSTARMQNEDTGDARGQLPREIALLRATWDFAELWQLSGQFMHFGDYERETDSTPPDPRPDMKGHDTFDLSLRARWSNEMDFSLTIGNLFNADVREASNGPAPPQPDARIPHDLPQPGTSATLAVTMRW